MIARAFGVVIALSTVVAQPAFAAELYQPTGKWTVETLANECLLVRPYGTAKDPLFLALTKAPMGGGSHFTVLSKSTRHQLRNGAATIIFDNRPSISAKFDAMLLRNPSKRIEAKTLRSVSVDIEGDSRTLTQDAASVSLVVPGELNSSFALPNQTDALAALSTCATALGIKWGYSAEEQSRLAQPADSPKGLQSLFSANDYPTIAFQRGEKGRSRIRISVNELGGVSDCAVLATSGSESLDSASCEIVRSRAKFIPAKDDRGNPVRSLVVTTIYWILT